MFIIRYSSFLSSLIFFLLEVIEVKGSFATQIKTDSSRKTFADPFPQPFWGSGNMGACKWIVFVLSPILFTWLVAGCLMRFFFPSNIEDFVKDDGIDASRVCCRGCLAVFCFVVVAVVTFLFGLVANKSGCSCSLILAAVAELWFVLSIVLFAALGKLCRCS